MMKNRFRILAPYAAVVLLSLLSGCEKSVPRTDYFPLRDGNRWDYRLLDLPLLKRLEAGQTIETSSLDADLTSRKSGASDSELVPNAEFVSPTKDKTAPAKSESSASARRVVLELREAVDELTCRAVYDTAEQVWSKKNGYVGFQSSRGRNYLLILPPHTGYKWVVTGPAGQDLFYEIESAASSVTTPAGAFAGCALARQESHDRREIFKYWFAPNVGLVRRSKYFAGQEVFRQELVEYSVKPATPATRMAEDREVRHAIEGKNHGSEFRDLHKDARDRRLESGDPPENDPSTEKVRKFADPK